MACSHESCTCAIQGCGIDHPNDWKPAMVISINGHSTGGDDPADCLAHYLLSIGYPTDQPEHLRRVCEARAVRRPV